jgi:two-component system chemotaxis response regulator CheB
VTKQQINAELIARDVVTIGASAGGVEALIHLLSKLPSELPAAIGIVLHRSPFVETQLPLVLGRRSALSVSEAEDGQALRRGTVYVAPRDQHLLFGDGIVRLSRGPKEHRTRPAIDPLFRTASATFGNRVVGVLLSGMGGDGVPGLIEIKSRHGLSLVQRPDEALHPTMPRTAIAEDDVDGILSLDELAAALTTVATGGVFVSGREGAAA